MTAEPGCLVQVLVRCTPPERLPLLGSFMALLDGHAARAAGFAGASVLSSTDGTQLTALLAWQRREDWLAFSRDPAVVAAGAVLGDHAPEVREMELAHRLGQGAP